MEICKEILVELETEILDAIKGHWVSRYVTDVHAFYSGYISVTAMYKKQSKNEGVQITINPVLFDAVVSKQGIYTHAAITIIRLLERDLK